MGEVSYKGHRYPAEIIAHCVWLSARFPLSFREDRGADVSPRRDSRARDDEAVVQPSLKRSSTRPACAAANPDPATSGTSTRCS